MSIIHLINKCIMGSGVSVSKVNYEDIQCVCRTATPIQDHKYSNYYAPTHTQPWLLINTLPSGMQGCLIPGTLPIDEEEVAMNALIAVSDGKNREIIVYGKNANDDTVYKKYQQLMGLGFRNVRVYPGGMFEWLLLQDIYGAASFPTTSKEMDLLKYKPPSGRQKRLMN
jgi:rhodanese-related sulfurtransferase